MKQSFLFATTAILFMLSSCDSSDATNTSTSSESSTATQPTATVSAGELKVAYINSDTLFTKYQLFKDLEEDFIEEKVMAEGTYTAQLRKLESDYRDAQAEAANLSESELQRMGMILQQREQELMAQKQQMEARLMESEQDKNDKLYEELRTFLDAYAADLGYHMIYGYTGYGDVLYMDPQFDITNIVIDSLNRSYAKSQLEETATK